MKKILLLLLICSLIFSVVFSFTSCRRDKDKDDDDTPVITPSDEDENTVDVDGSTINDNRIELPPISIPSTDAGGQSSDESGN